MCQQEGHSIGQVQHRGWVEGDRLGPGSAALVCSITKQSLHSGPDVPAHIHTDLCQLYWLAQILVEALQLPLQPEDICSSQKSLQDTTEAVPLLFHLHVGIQIGLGLLVKEWVSADDSTTILSPGRKESGSNRRVNEKSIAQEKKDTFLWYSFETLTLLIVLYQEAVFC